MNIEVVKSNKGNPKLIIDGYAYHLERKGKTFQWVCAENKSLMCKGRVLTLNLNGWHTVKKGPSDHSHDPSSFDKTIFKTNEFVKNRAIKTSSLPSQIIRSSVVKCSPENRVYLPTIQAQKQKIIRARSSTVKEPDNILNITIPEQLKYLEGEQFVLAEKSFGGHKIILLGTSLSFKLLAEAKCWLMDATFEVVPLFMRQLFTVHGKIGHAVVPLLFCIMSAKSEQAYFETFCEICRLACEWKVHLKPKRIISDFEKASVSALKMFFPEAEYKGCLFHFGQIIWRRVQAQDCAAKYGNNEDFSLHIRMLKSLSLVPADEVILYYRELKKTFDSDAQKIGVWFEKNYLTGRKRQTKLIQSKPMYSPNFWPVLDGLNHNFPRTQNSVESWHRRLQIIVGKSHIGLYQLISELGKELIVAKFRVQQTQAGASDKQNVNVECGKSEKLFAECFKNMSAAEQAAMTTVKIPISMEEITNRCAVFTRGMKCTDDYLNKCLEENLRKIINNDVYGAKYFYKILCNDKNFQKDYIRHKECLYFIQHDWETCTKEFKDVLKQEIARIKSEPTSNMHYMQLCCVKYGYENCVLNSAKYKCRKDSSIFAHDMAKMLTSEKQFNNCGKIDKSICSSSTNLDQTRAIYFSVVIVTTYYMIIDKRN